jgi:hypothetical protein
MRSMRIAESSVLGYPIERLDEYDDTGLPCSIRYEVMCPYTGMVLGSYPTLRAARRRIILRELRVAQRLSRESDAAVRVA